MPRLAGALQARRDELRLRNDALLVVLYLRRIGLCPESLVDSPPSRVALGVIHEAHVTTVPFENLNQHEHESAGRFEHVSRAGVRLEIRSILHKIIRDRRGGFCFELNSAFAWLLQQLGYTVRLMNCQVAKPGGWGFPSHVIPAVRIPGEAAEFLCDPGFGDPPRAAVPLPQPGADPAAGQVFRDTLGDEYRFQAAAVAAAAAAAAGEGEGVEGEGDEMAASFSTILLRRRRCSSPRLADWLSPPKPPAAAVDGGSGGEMPPPPSPPVDTPANAEFEPVYRFRPADDLPYDAHEFVQGLNFVLTCQDIFFTQKRICSLGTKRGHVTLCGNRVKWTDKGSGGEGEGLVSVRQAFFSEANTAEEWRAALGEHFGIVLSGSCSGAPVERGT
jgi:hypothetical protein